MSGYKVSVKVYFSFLEVREHVQFILNYLPRVKKRSSAVHRKLESRKIKRDLNQAKTKHESVTTLQECDILNEVVNNRPTEVLRCIQTNKQYMYIMYILVSFD